MLSPTHPVRYFASFNIRRMSRRVSDQFSGLKFSTIQTQPVCRHNVVSNRSPIFRNLLGVRHELQANKRCNLEILIPYFNGVVIQPGETFSFWHLAGVPSATRGFLTGLVIKGDRPGEGIGGGLCQMSNSIFWCLLHTKLTITERHRHSFDLFPDDKRSVPFGLGAAVAWGVKDLRARNDTSAPIQLMVKLDDDDLVVEIFSEHSLPWRYQLEERDSKFYKKADGRVFRRNHVIRKEMITGHEAELFVNDFECRYNVDEFLIRNINAAP